MPCRRCSSPSTCGRAGSGELPRANASAEHLVRHVHETGPRAVALSCSLSASLPRVRRQVEAVRATGTPVVVGGSAFDPAGVRACVIGATAYARSGAEGGRGPGPAVRGLPGPAADPRRRRGGHGIYADREELTAALRARVAGVYPVSDVGEVLAGWHRALNDHLLHLVGAVSAPLLIRDPAVLADAVTWLRSVLAYRGAPEDVADRVLAELRRVLAEHPEASRLLAGS